MNYWSPLVANTDLNNKLTADRTTLAKSAFTIDTHNVAEVAEHGDPFLAQYPLCGDDHFLYR